jgi:hypothetical protein
MKKLSKIFLMFFVVTLFAGCGAQSAEQAAVQAQENFPSQLDLALLLEDNLGLKGVLISQEGENLFVRFKAPTLKGEELNSGLVQVLAFIDQRASEDIKTIKLIFVINHVDSMIIEVPREEVSLWTDGKISNQELVNKFKVTSLIK